MEIVMKEASGWSEQVFGHTVLGDKRLTKRLVQIGKQLSSLVGSSLSKSCGGDQSLIEGSYRFLRNEKVQVEAIACGGYQATSELAKKSSILLALEDTTTLSYSHKVIKELGDRSNKQDAGHKGYLVHSTMLMDAQTEKTLGLIAQHRWCRSREDYGKAAQRAQRVYEEKESYKWEKNSEALSARLGDKLAATISVCDREADIYEYMQYKLENAQRFIIRGFHNRRLQEVEPALKEYVLAAPLLGNYTIEVGQKAKRKKRGVELELRATRVNLSPPRRRNGQQNRLQPIAFNVVYVKEKTDKTDNILEWLLFTTEAIETFGQARQVSRYYELRWRIEDFHKAWKTGTKVEHQRMQSVDTLEKMIVILSFVAIRLLQLKEHFEQPTLTTCLPKAKTPCTELLSQAEWQVLWQTIEKKPLPAQTPSAAWAFRGIAKLGGWADSKRTGRASWSTIWDGWFKLTERVEGFLLAQQIFGQKI